MKRGWLSLIVVLGMVVTFWISPGAYGMLLGGLWLLLLASLPALCISGLARVFVPRRAWRLLLVPLLSGLAYVVLSQYLQGLMPAHAHPASAGFTAVAGILCGGLIVILLELALGTPERFLRTPHDQHP